MDRRYTIGVMKTPVEAKGPDELNTIVDEAVAKIEDILAGDMDLEVKLLEFAGPHLSPVAGAYSPLDFLQLGLAEKLERKIDFLLLVTEVDLSASTLSYVLALPSQLTNVGILSTRRLSPSFWGQPQDRTQTVRRLSTLMLHTIGHLLNVPHSHDPANAMYDFQEIGDLDKMQGLTAEQIGVMQRNLPVEAREKVTRQNKGRFVLRQIVADWSAIWHAVIRANPLRLVTRLPTMMTAALSVDIVLFFSAEVWDVGGTVELWQLLLFSLVSLMVATFVLYHAFALGAVQDRSQMLSESTVVTAAVTMISLFLTMLLIYIPLFALFYLGTITIFPRRLMATWPTVDPATKAIDHVKLSLFLAAMGVLAGSLGGRADSKTLIRHVLFLDEET